MSKLNLNIGISISDLCSNSGAYQTIFKRVFPASNMDISKNINQQLQLSPGETKTAYSSVVANSSDNTTHWSIEPDLSFTNVYTISLFSGTSPNFRTPRTLPVTNLTEITLEKNGIVTQITSSTALTFANANVGDQVRLGEGFNTSNLGVYTIIAKTSSSISIEAPISVGETVTLGSDYLSNFIIYSSNGTQIGDKIKIEDGFSSVYNGVYDIIDVAPTFIKFKANPGLPTESDISNSPSSFIIYKEIKSFIYIEATNKVSVKINGGDEIVIKPFYQGMNQMPGIFMANSEVTSVEIINDGFDNNTVTLIMAE